MRCAFERFKFLLKFRNHLLCVAVFCFQIGKILDSLIKFGFQFFSNALGGLALLWSLLKFITQFPGSLYNRRVGHGIICIKIDRHIGTVDALDERLETFWIVWFAEEID